MTIPYKTYCVTAQHRVQHVGALQGRAQQAGIPFVEPFYTIPGEWLGIGSTEPARADSSWFPACKHVGIGLGHFTLWEALRHLEYDATLILEDDAEFHPRFETLFDHARRELPDDWDFVFVGSVGQKHSPTMRIAEHVYQICWPLGNHAYMVRWKALPILIERIRDFRDHIDIELANNILPFLRCYTFVPSLVRQTNNEKFADNDWIF